MQDDRAFKCSRCGNYEYETELAEKVCKNCASKAVVENCHSLQQRYAEISALVSELEDTIANFGRPYKIVTQLKRAVQKLQQ